MHEISCNPNVACQDAYIGETSHQYMHRLKQNCQSSYNEDDSEVFKHIIASGHHIDVYDVTILDREANRFDRGVKVAVMVKQKNPSLNYNGSTSITLSHSWGRSMDTVQLISISDMFRKFKLNRMTTPTAVVTTTTTLKKTSCPSRNVGSFVDCTGCYEFNLLRYMYIYACTVFYID